MKKSTSKTVRKQAQILTLDISGTSKRGVLRHIRVNLKNFDSDKAKPGTIFITTPNPEQALLALTDKHFEKIVNASDYSLPDGIGLSQAQFFMDLSSGKNKLHNLPVYLLQGVYTGLISIFKPVLLKSALNTIHGSDMFWNLVNLANKIGWRVYLVGGKAAPASVEGIKKSHKKLEVKGVEAPVLGSTGLPVSKKDEEEEERVVGSIRDFKPHIVFVGLGAPKQEKWVERNLDKLSAGVVMVVGGTFDYVSGKVSSPPGLVKKLEIEWIWRFFTRGRVRRVFNASVVFPWKVFLAKLNRVEEHESGRVIRKSKIT